MRLVRKQLVVLNANRPAQNLLQEDLEAVQGKRGGDIIMLRIDEVDGTDPPA